MPSDNPYGVLCLSNMYEIVKIPSTTNSDPASDMNVVEEYSRLQHPRAY